MFRSSRLLVLTASCFVVITAAVVIAVIATPSRLVADGAYETPVFIGVKGCNECHEGRAAGNQFSRWRMSAHADAFASLATPEAVEIARLSGITEPPHEAKQCLGCHATAADVEDWERDDGVRVEDGVQCEKCHAPGSEYAERRIMKRRKLAVAHGLVIPTEEDCHVCHRPKGSHDLVLGKNEFDLEKAWAEIAHEIPDDWDDEEVADAGEAAAGHVSRYGYTGVAACAACHKGPAHGFQFSKWRDGPHARAFAVLATERAAEIAAKAGVGGDPQTSAACLSCHTTGHGVAATSFAPEFDHRDGVQCESCHGPGSAYSAEEVMKDADAAKKAGLIKAVESTCRPCHEKPCLDDAEPFDYDAAVKAIAHPKVIDERAPIPRYKTPLNLAARPDGAELWIACEASDTVIVVDARTSRKVAEIEVGGQPNDVTFHPAGRVAYVTNRLDDTLSVVDVGSRREIRTVAGGDEPHGVLTDRGGKYIFVVNTGIDSISVIDSETFEEIKRLSASRSPWSLALSPDGKRISVTNTLSRFVEPRTPSLSEVTEIDVEYLVVVDRREVPAANLLQGIAWHPSGEYALFTLNRTKNLVPMTRLLQGWTITNGMGILWKDGTVDQVLLDHPDICFPDPADVTITPNGAHALVTSSGSNRVAIVDLEKLTAMIKGATPYERRRVYPNHVGKPTEFVVAFVETENSPRGVLCSADNRTAWVVNALSDSVTVIDLEKREAAGHIELGGSQEISRVRRGEILFHSANITFRRQFSCHTCHPDGHIDGITYDIEPDGIGVSPVDNRTLRGILDTAPFKWEGTNPTLQRQCGPRLAVFFTRINPLTPDELVALENNICTIPRPPNRYRALGAPLTEAQRRGRAMFERTRTNDGRTIPVEGRCKTCHPPPLFTDGRVHDVGTKTELDREHLFDAPHLMNIYDSAPYLHDGSAETLEEIWTRFNPYDEHGVTNDMTKDQLNDLIQYLKTL